MSALLLFGLPRWPLLIGVSALTTLEVTGSVLRPPFIHLLQMQITLPALNILFTGVVGKLL